MHPTCKDKENNKVKRRRIQKQCRIDVEFFPTDDVSKAINTTKTSKAQGPDNIAPVMLKHHDPIATKYLIGLIHLSIPNIIDRLHTPVSINKNPKILGVTFDLLLTFN